MSFARRIVIDTGVLVSAVICPESIPALAVEKAFLNFDVCISIDSFAELQKVLMRPKFNRYVEMDARQEFIQGFVQRAVLIDVKETVVDCIDPKDNKFLALAYTAEAELILASDPHLTDMHPWRDIPIIPPAAFLVGIN